MSTNWQNFNSANSIKNIPAGNLTAHDVQAAINELDTEKQSVAGLADYTKTLAVADVISKGPWVDVRAFGAVGDGVTDDTAAIQAAIDSLTNGGTILLPLKHKITTINMKTGVNVKGVSQYNSGLITTSEKAINFPNNTYYCSLNDFGMWGSFNDTTFFFFDGGVGGGVADINVSDVYTSNGFAGVQSTYAWGIVFQRVRFQNVKRGVCKS